MIPQKKWQWFFPGFFGGSSAWWTIILQPTTISKHKNHQAQNSRPKHQHVHLQLFACNSFSLIGWDSFARFHGPKPLTLTLRKKQSVPLPVFGRIGCGVLGVYMVVWQWNLSCTVASIHLKWINPSISSSMRGDGATQDLWSSIGSRRSSWGYISRHPVIQWLLREVSPGIVGRNPEYRLSTQDFSRDLTHRVTNMHTNKSEDVTDKDAKTLLLQSTGQSCALMSLSLTSSGPIFTRYILIKEIPKKIWQNNDVLSETSRSHTNHFHQQNSHLRGVTLLPSTQLLQRWRVRQNWS